MTNTSASQVAIRALVSLLLVLPITLPRPVQASDAEDELGNWLIYNGTLHFTDRWSLFTEAQLRLWEPASNIQEYFVRGIGYYHLNPTVTLGLGYTWVKAEPFADESPESEEDRLIQQLSAKHKAMTTNIEHRFRLEQRWIDKDGESTSFRNRFRYRLQATTPLRGDTIEAGSHFINVYNELMLNFGNRDDTFDQNRLYGAYGWQFTKHANLQLGLLWQYKKREDFWRAQIFYTHNFDFR